MSLQMHYPLNVHNASIPWAVRLN